ACVRFFHRLSSERLLCVIGDFGDISEDDLQGHGPPGFGAGGAFWLAVNFHALGAYSRGLGGRARHPRHRHLSLNVSILLFGSSGFEETDLAYADAID